MIWRIWMERETELLVRGRIRDIPDYPKKGIVFKDITPLLKDKGAFEACIDELAKDVRGLKPDYIVGMESRGFILGGALAYKLKLGFIPARKQGKLPYDKVSRSYGLEYGTATLEMHKDAIERGSKILIVDDLLATGGTAKATAGLVEELGGKVLGFAFLIELAELNGRKALPAGEVISLIKY